MAFSLIRSLSICFLLSLSLMACEPSAPTATEPAPALAVGIWHMAMDLDSTAGELLLPFQFDVVKKKDKWGLVIHNQDEAIAVDSVLITGDSILIRMPFFDSDFHGQLHGDSAFSGVWLNHYKGPGYAIPFVATAGEKPRFAARNNTAPASIAGDWEVHFIDGDNDEPAIGIFSVGGSHVKGSFATETGDLRFQDGIVTRDSLFLSSFNGSQAFLFRAAVRNDSLVGEFRSGYRYKQAWYGVRNPNFKLADDETATTMDPAHPFAFAFPDLKGEIHRSTDMEYRGQVMVVEIMGTWCPNCLDQATMLNGFHEKYSADGLRVVGLAFERSADTKTSVAALERFHKGLGIGYQVLYAGVAKADTVKAKLPFISQLKSYPTTFLVGRDGTVRHIYTGIYGPGTGERYVRFKDRMENAIVQLLQEPKP